VIEKRDQRFIVAKIVFTIASTQMQIADNNATSTDID
jgi:hypothetical protein